MTKKAATRKTEEEFEKELDMIEEKMEMENIELEKIIASGKKKKVDLDTYSNNFDHGEYRVCMNFDHKTGRCKENMPNINPWYTKDNNLSEDCPKWDYVYETDDK